MKTELIDMVANQWQQKWNTAGPFYGPYIRDVPSNWVRFHMLPESKRYPENDSEMSIILDRHHKLIGELMKTDEMFLITTQWSSVGNDPNFTTNPIDQDALLWHVEFESSDETDPEFFTYRYYYVSRRKIDFKIIDDLLVKTANDEMRGTIIASSNLELLYHPYDGGVDIFSTSENQIRDLKSKYAAWLSKNPQGL